MKKLLSVLLAAGLLLCSLAACGKSGDVSVPYGMQLASDTSVVDYYLFIPQKWTVDMANGATSAYYSTDDPSSITMTAYGLSDAVSDAESYWDFFTKQFEGVFGEPESVETSNLLLDGKEAMQYVFTAKLGDTEYKFRQIVCTRNKMAYILTYASTAENYDKHADEVQETISQFRFMA